MRDRIGVRLGLASCLAAAGLLVGAAGAQASYHEMRISEIHASGGLGDSAYVELTMYSPGQNFLANRSIQIYDNSGAAFGSPYTFPTSPSHGANQSTILIANGPTGGGQTADFDAGGYLSVNTGAGAVCYLQSLVVGDGLDCVAYGLNFGSGGISGNPSPFGSKAIPTADGLLSGQTLQRSITRGCQSLFEASDDTNDGSDWALGAPSPRNNSAGPSGIACPNTSIKGPGKTEDRSPSFKLKSTVANSTFRCRLDGGDFAKCKPSLTLKKLSVGKHVLRAFATNSRGGTDKSAAKHKFTVKK